MDRDVISASRLQQSTDRTTVRLPLDRISIDPDNLRSSYDEEHISSLREALRSAVAMGTQYINPPVVYPVGRDRYQVKHGNCRVLAAQGVVDALSVFVDEPPASKGEKILEQLSENLLQGGLNPVDTGHALRKLRDSEELSIGGIVDILRERGLSKGKFWVTMRLGLTRLDPTVQEMVRRGKVSARAAWTLRSLTPAQQVEWAERMYKEGLNFIAVTQQLREIGILPQDFNEELEYYGPRILEIDGPGPIENAPQSIEYQQAQLQDKLAEAAERLASGDKPRQMPDASHRSGELTRRWELLPISRIDSRALDDAPLDAADETWLKTSSENERMLAQEVCYLGRRSPSEAIQLVKEAIGEVPTLDGTVVTALNDLRRLVERPHVIDGESAVAQLLAIRLEHVLERLRRPDRQS